MPEQIRHLTREKALNDIGLSGTPLDWQFQPPDITMQQHLETWQRIRPTINKGDVAQIRLTDSHVDAIGSGVDLSNLFSKFAIAYDIQIETAIGGSRSDGYFLYIRKH